MNEFLLEEVFELVFVWVFDEFVEFLLVDVEHNSFELARLYPVFEGAEEGDSFVEVALEHDFLEELYFFAVVGETHLNDFVTVLQITARDSGRTRCSRGP